MLTTDKILYKRSVDEFNSIPENFAVPEVEFYKNAETYAQDNLMVVVLQILVLIHTGISLLLLAKG